MNFQKLQSISQASLIPFPIWFNKIHPFEKEKKKKDSNWFFWSKNERNLSGFQVLKVFPFFYNSNPHKKGATVNQKRWKKWENRKSKERLFFC